MQSLLLWMKPNKLKLTALLELVVMCLKFSTITAELQMMKTFYAKI